MYHMNNENYRHVGRGVIVLAILLVGFMLSGCSIGGEKKIKIFQVEEPRQQLDYPLPTPLELEQIKWR